ncbi:hypothetical protein [Haloplanus aerogenes]|uniref:Uncharacterized protein n=1 Tax=Haloplanus aerogenes TaxID=660522 RepID=A0A3M0DWM9_9EURY|nr:hypothetical protein [Haloplanus aerogenes]RMB23816.1 hypothetical protein ATH50_1046 [Haloplanus aerogenes]
MQPFFGDEPDDPEPDEQNVCDDCGSRMEWTLGLDGVQRRECPNCDT